MRKTILYVIFLALFLACEKELEIDYHSSEMLYVAEVLLTPDLATARVTRTRGVMESPSDSSFVTDAKVTIRMEGDPWADTLRNRGRGRYTSPYLADEGKENGEFGDVADNGGYAFHGINVLFDATIASIPYDSFVVTDYINDEYFYINSVDDVEN